MPIEIINNSDDLDALEQKVTDAISKTINQLKNDIGNLDAEILFSHMKFSNYGHHPLEHRPLNLIEQLNQTYTYLASIRAAKWLLEKHPELVPFRLNLGTSAGSDIESQNGQLAAETFATVNPKNNNKLKKDIEKVSGTEAAHKYVFYICPDCQASESTHNTDKEVVKIISLGCSLPIT